MKPGIQSEKCDSMPVWIDRAILLCLSVLFVTLPIAHIPTIRAFALFIPAGLLLIRAFQSRKFYWDPTSYELQFVIFFVVAVSSIPFSVNSYRSIREVWGELITPIILFYTVYLGIRKERDISLLMSVFFFGNLVFSCYSFYDFAMHEGNWLTYTIYRAGGLRDPGGGEAAALYHTIVIPFIFWGAYYFKKPWPRTGLVVLLIINLVALHITYCRAAILAVGVQIFFAAMMLMIEKRRRMGILFLVVPILVGSFYIESKMFREMQTDRIPSIRELIELSPEQLVGSSSKGMQQRLGMWKTALLEIGKNPFYPHGYGRFLFGKIVKTEKNKHFIFAQTHNTFIGMAFELGIQGLIVFLWMIGTFLVVCWKNWRKSLTDKTGLSHYMTASLVTMMTGYWVNNFFGSFDGGDSKLLFMLLLGMGMAVTKGFPAVRPKSGTV
jgi:O-antigen ligase